MRGNINSWFKSYLTDQKKSVEINEGDHINFRQDIYLSSYIVLTHGVPKGLALGCLLLLIYMRVVPKVMINFFLQANWEQQTKESMVVDGTSCCVTLECLVKSIACIT